MAERQKFEYQGKEYTLTGLTKISGIGRTTLKKRLEHGWSVELAVETPPDNLTYFPTVPEEFDGQILEIRFVEPIYQINPDMRPELFRSYIAKPAFPKRSAAKGRQYFTIVLENGKILIVYPDEFEIVGVAKETASAAILP